MLQMVAVSESRLRSCYCVWLGTLCGACNS